MLVDKPHITFQEIIDSLNNDVERERIFTRLKQEQPVEDDVKGIKLFLEENNYNIEKLKTFLQASENQYDKLLQQPITSKTTFNRLKIAAALLPIVALSSYFLFFSETKNDILYAEYYQKEVGLPVVMSISLEKQFSEAMNAFKDNAFEEAKTGFELLLKQNQKNDTLLYFAACSNMELELFDDAILQFKQVSLTSVFIEKTRFKLTLCYLKTNQIEEAKQTLSLIIKTDGLYAEKAKELLQVIN